MSFIHFNVCKSRKSNIYNYTNIWHFRNLSSIMVEWLNTDIRTVFTLYSYCYEFGSNRVNSTIPNITRTNNYIWYTLDGHAKLITKHHIQWCWYSMRVTHIYRQNLLCCGAYYLIYVTAGCNRLLSLIFEWNKLYFSVLL